MAQFDVGNKRSKLLAPAPVWGPLVMDSPSREVDVARKGGMGG